MTSRQDTGAQTTPSSASRAVRVPAAAVAALIVGAAPCLVFWFAVRGADGTYPAGSETLVLVASPFLGGLVFALPSPRPILRWSAAFAAVWAVPLALLTILVIYSGNLDGLGSAPLATVAAWVLCWIIGFVGAAIGSRVRVVLADVRATSLGEWLRGWWARRTCHHDWELQETQELLGGRHRTIRSVDRHYIYVYRCRSCGAVRARSDRWGPVS